MNMCIGVNALQTLGILPFPSSPSPSPSPFPGYPSLKSHDAPSLPSPLLSAPFPSSFLFPFSFPSLPFH